MKTWPETMCSDDWRPALTTPIRLDGELIFTDGRLLVVLKDDGREAEDWDGDPRNLSQYTTLRVDGGYVFDVDELKAWAGEHTSPCPDCDGGTVPVCDTCEGEGYVDPDCKAVNHRCRACQGDGALTRENNISARGVLDGVSFNCRQLAYLLDGAPGGELRLAPQEENQPIYVEGEGWHGLLMPVRPLDPINPIAAEVRPLEPIGRKVIPA